MSTLLQRGRRRLGYVAVRLRDQRVVAADELAAVRVAGPWRWVQELPGVSRDDLRARHLATVVDALAAVGVDHFVVPDPSGHRPQVGVPADRMGAALQAVAEATGDRGWYGARARHHVLLPRLSTGDTRTLRVFPRYRAVGTQYVTGPELGVAIVPWHRHDGGHEPEARNAYLSQLRDGDLDDRAHVHAHGRWWPSLAAFAAPHPEARPPLRWLVVVPPELRRQDPDLADLLGRYAARSVWFHAAIGSTVTLLDRTPAGWLDDGAGPDVRPPPDEGDVLDWLAAAWAREEAPAAVLPAGGLLVDDLPARRLVSPGGLGLFHPALKRLAPCPPAGVDDPLAEARRLRDWFHRRTGAWMPFAPAALPSGLPAPDADLMDEVAVIVDDPRRPRVAGAETALMVLAWVAYLRGRAVPGNLPAARHRAGNRRFTTGMASLATSAGAATAVSVDPASLVEVDGATPHVASMAADRLPRPAPWEA